jgi:hypothetical protein
MSMASIISRLQLSNKHPEGPRYQHIKSPSLPAPSPSNFHQSERFPPSQPQITSVVPSKKNREYSVSRKEEQGGEEEELKKRLFRSKTSVTRAKASSSALGSRSPSPSISSPPGPEHFSPPPPSVPPKKSREYTSSRREDELRKGLLRSKTSVTRSSAVAPSSAPAPGSKYYRSPAHHPTSFSPSPSSSHPKRTTSQASRISSLSTTSTLTPMKTT